MTKKEAKALSLEMWRYLAEHPKIVRKGALPQRIFKKIKYLSHWCPLCEVFAVCTLSCPLGNGDGCGNGAYREWCEAEEATARAQAARKLVRMIEAWEVDE